MFLRNKKTETEIFIEQLHNIRQEILDSMIESNQKIDDFVCETYYAAGVLLSVYDPDWV